jgi:ATP-dependent DNA ligase
MNPATVAGAGVSSLDLRPTIVARSASLLGGPGYALVMRGSVRKGVELEAFSLPNVPERVRRTGNSWREPCWRRSRSTLGISMSTRRKGRAKKTDGLPLSTTLEPMEAALADELPKGDGWIYEPKWDGFRCLAFRGADAVDLRSKAGKPLARYFPDIVEAILSVMAESFVLDGEIVIPVGPDLSFDDLLLRIHPAESRVRKLAASHPALFIAFDLLADDGGRDLTDEPLGARREALEAFAEANFASEGRVRISPWTDDHAKAARWLKGGRQGLDGVIAKQADLPYQSGNRRGMRKVKRMRTADCVVGGFRPGKSGRLGSMLLGLYGDDGLLHHVGFCSALNAKRRKEAEALLKPLSGGEGFTGNAPTGQSRWRKGEAAEWVPVEPRVVVEVQYDHFTGGRFRHGTRFLRWRPDKEPESCGMDQLEAEGRGASRML